VHLKAQELSEWWMLLVLDPLRRARELHAAWMN
jgi:hypothetical protein